MGNIKIFHWSIRGQEEYLKNKSKQTNKSPMALLGEVQVGRNTVSREALGKKKKL